jgi:hypothetical protein
MRISEDRYSRERLCLKLALKFLEFEARTQTIRAWTGLSDDRIRKLYRSYMTRANRYVPRHRGKSPHQIAFFARSFRVQQETVWLAALLTLFGVLPDVPNGEAGLALPNVGRGMLLCLAYEAYQLMMPNAQISFEHAVFLAKTLACGELLRLAECVECHSLIVTERFPIRDKRCHHCLNPANR